MGESIFEAWLPRLKKPLKDLADRAPALATLPGYVAFKATHSKTLSKYHSGDVELVREIELNGFAILPGYYPIEFCQRCIADIESIFRDHPEHVETTNDRRVYGAEVLSESIMRFHAETRLQDVANHYSCVKTGNAFTLASRVSPADWTLPRNGGWHRDLRYRQFKAFLYLNDVTPDNGPIQVVHRSHRIAQHLWDVQTAGLPFTQNGFVDEQIQRVVRRDPSRLRTLTGKAGTLILADTSILHRGCPPRSGARYALTNYYFEKADITPAKAKAFFVVNPKKMLSLLDDW
jgi:Phytanoyl-CoA dioxygenase (PhyH)